MTNEKNKHLQKEASKHEKRPKSRKRLGSGIASFSLIIFLFDKLSDIFCNALVNGFWGRICSGYTKLQNSFKNGFLKEFLFKDRKIKKLFRHIRKFLSGDLESCFIVTRGRKIIRFFSAAPLNYYGSFGLFFGLYVIVVYFVRMIIPDIETAGVDYLIIGIALIIVSLPLLFSKVSLSNAILKSSIGKLIVQGCFGISDETLAKNIKPRRGKGNLMLFFGLVAGILAFFIHPMKILIAIFMAVVLVFIASSPEIGVLLTVTMVPFLSFMSNPTICLCACVLTTSFFYAIKLIRGKRVFKFELVDGVIFLFGLIIFFASIFSAGGIGSRNSALVSCTLMLGYFLLVNLMRTEAWIKRCVVALVGSATIVASIGIFEYFFGESSSNWLDISLFSGIRVRIVSLFDNPNVLATFLVLIFPFSLVYLVLSKNRNEKFISLFACILLILATVFTWSRGAWIAMAVCTVIFFTLYSKKTLRMFGVLLLAMPVLPMLLPDNVIDRILSIFNLSDSSISYRIYTWIGSMRAIKDYWVGGIGYGTEAFQKIYPYYAYSGIEAAEHSHSLFLQVMLGLGVGGILTLVVLLFLYFQKCFEYIQKPENNESKFYTAAAVISIIGALIMGIFDYIWFNYRVFFIFWIIIAIGCAFVRVGNNEHERKLAVIDDYQLSENNELN